MMNTIVMYVKKVMIQINKPKKKIDLKFFILLYFHLINNLIKIRTN